MQNSTSNTMTIGQLHWSDLIVIVLYYIGTLVIGIWTICKTKNNVSTFFLAGRSLTWWPIGMSLFASNIGSINFVGIAGSGAASGLAVVMFEWNAIFLLLLLGWLFVPVYISSGIYTIPEFLHLRFGGERLRVYLSIIALLTYAFAILSVDLYSGALFIQHTTGYNIYIGVAILLGTTVLFTTLGGLRTVVLTDAFAVVIMISGGIILFILGMIKVGGLRELKHLYSHAIPEVTLPNKTCGFPREDAWHIFRNSWNSDFPALATFLRTVFGALWFWCANQLIVQRSLAAKNIVHAKGGSLLASYLKLTPMIIMVLPGMISRALFPNEVACATPEACTAVCNNPAGCSNIAYPKLATELLPNGLRGLLIAAMIAAVISSLTSVFNSSGSIVTMDIWTRFRKKCGEKELLIVNKVFLLILTGISVLWIPIMQQAEGGQIYVYATATVGLFGGPTCAIYLMAVLWGRLNEPGAFWGLVVGQLWGMIRFVLDVIYPAPYCGQLDTRPGFLKYWHVYYHAVSQIVLSAVIASCISVFTKPIPPHKLCGVTYWTRFQKLVAETSSQNEEIMLIANCDNDLDEDISHESTDEVEYSKTKDKLQQHYTVTSKQPRFSQKLYSIIAYCYIICCKGTKSDVTELSSNMDSDHVSSRLNSLKQSTFWTLFLNINAVVILLVLISLYIVLR